MDRLVDDFSFFIVALFDCVGYSSHSPIGEMELDICDFVANSGHAKRGVLAPRAVGKSTFISAGYSAWRLLRDPDTKILIVSKSKIPAARDIVRLIRGWLNAVWFLQHLNPSNATSDLSTDQTFQFDVAGAADSKTASVLAQGIDGMITGSRAHIVIADDVETPDNTKTVTARSDLELKVKEFFNVAKFGDKEILYVGTYHHEESLYLKLGKEGRGYHFRTWPFTYPNEGEQFLNLAPIIERNVSLGIGKPGEPTFSHRYTRKEVAEAQAEGQLNFLKQYQLVCNLNTSHKNPIKLRDLIVWKMHRDQAPIRIAWGTTNDRGGSTAITDFEVLGLEDDRLLHEPIFYDREWQSYTGTKAYIDPAGKGTDLTGLAIVSHLAGLLFVKGVYGLPGGASSERIAEIVAILKQHGVRDCYYETNIDTFDSYGSMLEVEMRKAFVEPGADPMTPEGWRCSLDGRRAPSTMFKEDRIIQCLEPVISAHRLVVSPDVLRPQPERPIEHELQFMLSRIQRVRKCLKEDGPIDALAGCVAEWHSVLRTDPTKGADMARTRAFDEALKEHFRLTGRKVNEPCWFNNKG